MDIFHCLNRRRMQDIWFFIFENLHSNSLSVFITKPVFLINTHYQSCIFFSFIWFYDHVPLVVVVVLWLINDNTTAKCFLLYYCANMNITLLLFLKIANIQGVFFFIWIPLQLGTLPSFYVRLFRSTPSCLHKIMRYRMRSRS